MDRVPRGVPLWSSVGKPGDLRDRPADKINVHLDQGLGDQEDLLARSLDLCIATASGLILNAILLCTPSGHLTDL